MEQPVTPQDTQQAEQNPAQNQTGEQQLIAMVRENLPKLLDMQTQAIRGQNSAATFTRWMFLALTLVLLASVSILGGLKVIDSTSTATLIGGIVGYTIGSFKEIF